MEETRVVLNENRRGEVQLFSDSVKAGKMDIAILGPRLVVYHTEVNEQFEGRGFAKILLEKLLSFARAQGLMIVPICPFVLAQFRQDPQKYLDVWFKPSS